MTKREELETTLRIINNVKYKRQFLLEGSNSHIVIIDLIGILAGPIGIGLVSTP